MSQSAGPGVTCVFWAYMNAYRGLARGLPRWVKQQGDLPKRWRVFFRSCISYREDGLHLDEARDLFFGAKIGGGVEDFDAANPKDIGIYFSKPLYHIELFYLGKNAKQLGLKPYTDHASPLTFYTGLDIIQMCKRFEQLIFEGQWGDNAGTRYRLGLDYVAIFCYQNLYIRPQQDHQTSKDFLQMEAERVDYRHGVVLFHISDEKLWYWDTEVDRAVDKISPVKKEGADPDNPDKPVRFVVREDYKKRQGSCLRFIDFDQLTQREDAKGPYTTGIYQLMFVSLNKRGMRARDNQPDPPPICHRRELRSPIRLQEPDAEGPMFMGPVGSTDDEVLIDFSGEQEIDHGHFLKPLPLKA